MTGVEIELAIVVRTLHFSVLSPAQDYQAKGVLDPLTNAQHFKASNSLSVMPPC
ncbi:hypothetical protein CALCODRAFT_498475 [Calocera cornea HHB12733]|uniref:Uncharacterized protein n=1 Tax=Calocera cornea HHB12733 TaxID=1353952 RepID=A0A165EV22_9BASI|nr:hypothetical protein CALCODRAFT_498475 [Calocera cornea HHB12733]